MSAPVTGLLTLEERILFSETTALGTNLHVVNRSAEELTAPVYIDVIRNARPWDDQRTALENEPAPAFDAQGWPETFTDPQGSIVTWVGLNQFGDWTIEGRGIGSIALMVGGQGDPATLSQTQIDFEPLAPEQDVEALQQITFTVTDPDGDDVLTRNVLLRMAIEWSGIQGEVEGQPGWVGDPLTDLKLYPTDTVFEHPEKYDFNPIYLQRLGEASLNVLRPLDMTRTNFSGVERWSAYDPITNPTGRTSLDHWTQGEPSGLALEETIRLANAVGADLWLNIPHRAIETLGGDPAEDFVRGLADLLVDPVLGLQDGLKVYVEYSNETWNTGFGIDNPNLPEGQVAYLNNRIDRYDDTARYPEEILQTERFDNPWERRDLMTVEHSAQVWSAMESALNQANGAADPNRAASMMVRVIGARFYDDLFAQRRLEAFEIASINPSDQFPDTLAIAPYFRAPGAGWGVDDEGIDANELLARTWEHTNRDPIDIVLSGGLPTIDPDLLALNPFTGDEGQPGAQVVFQDVYQALKQRSNANVENNKNNFGNKYVIESLRQHQRIAETLNLPLVAYEGGQEIGLPVQYTPIGTNEAVDLDLLGGEPIDPDDPDPPIDRVAIFLAAAQEANEYRDEINGHDIGGIYADFLGLLNEVEMKLFVHYSYVLTPSGEFNWGMLERLDQVNAPKFQAFVTYAAENDLANHNLGPAIRVLADGALLPATVDGEIQPYEIVTGGLNGAAPPLTLDLTRSRDLDTTGPLTFNWMRDGAPWLDDQGMPLTSAIVNTNLGGGLTAGTHRIEVIATDADGGTNTRSILITVTEVGGNATITGQTEGIINTGGQPAAGIRLDLALAADGFLGTDEQNYVSLPVAPPVNGQPAAPQLSFGPGVDGLGYLNDSFAATGWEQTSLESALADGDYYSFQIDVGTRTQLDPADPSQTIQVPLTFMPESVTLSVLSQNGFGTRDLAVAIVDNSATGQPATPEDVVATAQRVGGLTTIDLRQTLAAQPREGTFEIRFYLYGNGNGEVTPNQHVGLKPVADAPEIALTGTFALRGDFNADGVLDAQDIDALSDEIASGANALTASQRFFDLDGNNLIDFNDGFEWVTNARVFGGPIGDINLDGRVNLLDLDVLGQNWQQSNRNWSGGDLNFDGRVDLLDLDLLGANFEV